MKPFAIYGRAANDVSSAVEREAQRFEFDEYGRGSSAAFGFPMVGEGATAQDLQKTAMTELLPSHVKDPVISIFWDATSYVVAPDVLAKSMSEHLDWRKEEVDSSSIDLDLVSSEFFLSAREFLVRSALSNSVVAVIELKMGASAVQLPLNELIKLLSRRVDSGTPERNWTSGAAILQIAEPFAYLVQSKHQEQEEEFRTRFRFQCDQGEPMDSVGQNIGGSAMEEAKKASNAQVVSSDNLETAPYMVSRRPSRRNASVIAKGQNSSVYLGNELEDGETIAIKVVEKEKLTTGEAANLVREMQILNAISSSYPQDNVVQALGAFDVSPFQLYVVMPLLRFDLQAQIQRSVQWQMGEPQKEGSNKSVLPLVWVQRITADVAAGLNHLHSISIVHCSVAPQHILLSVRIQASMPPPDELAKLCDFGAAQVIENGTVLATPYGMGVDAYLAPELVLASNTMLVSSGQGFEVDLWALGVVLHMCAFGVGLFDISSEDPKAVADQLRDWKLDREKLFERIECFSFGDLLVRLLERDANSRLKADEVLQHHFLRGFAKEPNAGSTWCPWCAFCSSCLSGRGR